MLNRTVIADGFTISMLIKWRFWAPADFPVERGSFNLGLIFARQGAWGDCRILHL